MSTYRMTYGSDTVRVEIGMPEHQIKVDGVSIGRQVADGSCRTEDCMRIAASAMWGAVYNSRDEAEALGRDPSAVCIWDDVEYEMVDATGEEETTEA